MSDEAKGPSATKEDKNPRGGLSAKGRKKFGVQKGVTNYSSASRKDKGRWVSWAMRFTGTPKPVKDDKGQPTRYALMFRAWGEKVPTSAADVRAVHAKAVTRSKQLKNADKAGLEENEQIECADCERVFADFAMTQLWTHVETVHLEIVEVEDVAHGQFACHVDTCDRSFLSKERLVEHAEAVHTFDDIQRLVAEAVREKYHKAGNYKASPPVGAVWAWVQDLADDWVVFTVETDGDMTLYKASYAITDGKVTLGDPSEVKRRTVYEPLA